MKRCLLVIAISATVLISSHSDGLNGWTAILSHYDSIRFSADGWVQVLDHGFQGTPYMVAAPYEYIVEHKVPFIEFQFDEDLNPHINAWLEGPKKRWLVLPAPGVLFAYDSELADPIRDGIVSIDGEGVRYRSSGWTWYDYSVSSHLVESDAEYGAENLKNVQSRRPWVEGVPGQGVGETISMESGDRAGPIEALVVSIGFVSYDTPSLYTRNSRPSTILITSADAEFSLHVDLEDTPVPQLIDLPEPATTITVTIVDVYPGTQWDDTCINFLMPLGAEP